MGDRRGTYTVLMTTPEGRKPLERPRREWENNIKMDLQEMGWGHARDRCGSEYGQVADLVNAVMNLRVP